MAVLLKDALRPNLLQTTEHTPMLVHTGPFGNIAHGNSSVLADLAGLKLADYVVTESGFGADMGFEKFMDIKCRAAGVLPDAAVVVCTVRALKMHSGRFRIVAGRPLDPGLAQGGPGVDRARRGQPAEAPRERARVSACRRWWRSIASGPTRQAELELVRKLALEAGAYDAEISEVWELGGEGGAELAHAVIAAAESSDAHQRRRGRTCCIRSEMPIKDKIEAIARTMYGADGVEYLPEANRQIRQYTELGWTSCRSASPRRSTRCRTTRRLKGRPSGFTVMVREVRAYTGAGFLCPIAGEIMTMPGPADQRRVPPDRPGRERRDRRPLLSREVTSRTNRS